MVAQDVGSAIKGPERGDIYFGSGDKAGRLAGVTKHPGNFFVLAAHARRNRRKVQGSASACHGRRPRRRAALKQAAGQAAAAHGFRTRSARCGSTPRATSSRIKGKKGRVHAALEDADGEPPPPAQARAAKAAAEASRAAAARPPRVAGQSRRCRRPPRRRSTLDRRKARKIGSGQDRDRGAHRPARHAPERGARGAAPLPDARAMPRGAAGCWSSPARARAARTALTTSGWSARASERGVLRRNVPRWLAEPELAAIVVGFTTAAIRHGGEGALYVQLRRRERAAPSGRQRF